MPSKSLQIKEATHGEADVAAAVNRVALIQRTMQAVMQKSDPEKGIDGHYGVIPGTKKPSLLKAGAEVLCSVFRLAATFPGDRMHRVLEKDFIMYEVACVLIHQQTGAVMGEGVGLCSSREEKYAYRKGSIACKECGNVGSIFKSKNNPGWYCWNKKGGCGRQWKDDAAYDSRDAEKVPNPNIWEQANTILKMAEKRALIAATLVTTGASDCFTQDIEDFVPMPERSGWEDSGSAAAQEAVRDAKLEEMRSAGVSMAPPQGEAATVDVEAEDRTAGPETRSTAPVGPRPTADPRAQRFLYAEQAADLARFAKAKVKVGPEAYYRVLGFHGVGKSTHFTSHADAEKCLAALTETAAAQKAERKRQADLAKAESDAASLLCSREGSGCSIPVANQIAACIKQLKTPWAEANMAMETTLADRKREYPDMTMEDHWNVILLGLQDVVSKRKAGL